MNSKLAANDPPCRYKALATPFATSVGRADCADVGADVDADADAGADVDPGEGCVLA